MCVPVVMCVAVARVYMLCVCEAVYMCVCLCWGAGLAPYRGGVLLLCAGGPQLLGAVPAACATSDVHVGCVGCWVEWQRLL